ncbi:hypothetical protein [Sphingomonas sp.]|uniref:hypothetical protein n=1 Tax=Sphingomonas sp. TaxID=28214 RepID=UPI001B0E839E|nr:hypothetical protein [Sphingomonas sp.]MBO9713516.1 hypothetical protein [Sphingomonas sp.]
MRMLLLASAAATAAHAAAPAPQPASTPAPVVSPTPGPTPSPGANSEAAADDQPHLPTLPPFAATLAQMAPIAGPGGWQGTTGTQAWHALATVAPDQRQATRWRYALGLIGGGFASEALGVLDVMLADEADLALVPSFQLARAATLTMLGRGRDAAPVLAADGLADNPEACAWLIRAFMAAGAAQDAMNTVKCALPAINARQGAARKPFLMAAIKAALGAGQNKQAIAWLALVPDRDGDANVLRGKALLANGDKAAARLRFERAAKDKDPEVQAGGRLGLVETALAANLIKPEDAINQLEAIRFSWRGGDVEAQALRDELRLATAANDLPGELRAGSILFRYFPAGPDTGPMMAQLQQALVGALAPGSKVPLTDAAGLYWEYRDLGPSGAEGDALVLRLADQLQQAGLYARAAELLGYQLEQRAKDVAQGPLSVKVAALEIMAGRPERAIDALRTTEQPSYTDQMRWDRKRMEAVALAQLGRTDAARAALDGVPDAAAVRAEISWRAKDWNGFVADSEGALPGKAVNDAQRAMVIRHAIALAMLGREDKLRVLGARYGGAFAGQQGEEAFKMLTAGMGAVDPGKLGAALAALPAANPPASIGDLLDAGT